jgi:hypothetical protein
MQCAKESFPDRVRNFVPRALPTFCNLVYLLGGIDLFSHHVTLFHELPMVGVAMVRILRIGGIHNARTFDINDPWSCSRGAQLDAVLDSFGDRIGMTPKCRALSCQNDRSHEGAAGFGGRRLAHCVDCQPKVGERQHAHYIQGERSPSALAFV